MKLRNILQLVALIAVGFSLTGCQKGLQKTTPLPGWAQKAPGDDDRLKPIDPGLKAGGPVSSDGLVPMGDRNLPDWKPSAEQPFKADTVYFEFDKATIKSTEAHKLDSIASRMKQKYRNKALRVEGHCDERGTEEYNRSLGERRAGAIREYLVRAGVDYQMIDTISYGEDRPAVPGHNEAAWSKNRRGEFVLLDPPR
jgi:peptidoglycan-associated lipoprotein